MTDGTRDTGAEAGGTTFEQALERLERIVEELERGERGLEDSLKLFEEGVTLAGRLEKRLADAEMKVEQLTVTDAGETEARPLDAGDEG